jgi:chemotaxis signal transduction protein
VIWNGKLNASSTSSQSGLGPVFSEIGRTSQQTIAAFEGAIRELKHLLLHGRRADLAAHALLAVDIMDRNLYERANDCRWWALSEEFASLLLALETGTSDAAVLRATEILAHLNSLYTVYRRVALFDRHGRILAVSKELASEADDCVIPAELLQKTLSLKGTQAYAVSAMVPHALADGEATYLYCAPIRQTGLERPVGAIALAFNCRDELQNMLQDSLPAGASALGLFVDHTGLVLASTHADIAVGSSPDFIHGLPTDAAGADRAHVCQWQGRSFLFGSAKSKGYREFKTSDGYREEVRSVLLTAVDADPRGVINIALPQSITGANSTQYGVVQCGAQLFALASTQVIEAVSAANLAAPPVNASDVAGMLKISLGGEFVVLPAYDCCKLTGQAPIADPTIAVAIVVQGAQRKLVLLVDRLVDVVVCDRLAPPPGGINPDAPWITGYLHDNQSNSIPVFALDPANLRLDA